MKIVFLNVDHGIMGKKLFDFIGSQISTTDIFCLQEADKNVRVKITKYFEDFKIYVSEKPLNANELYSIATTVKKSYPFDLRGNVLNGEPDIGIADGYTVSTRNGQLNLINVHGVSQPGDKLDNNWRIMQSESIIDFASNLSGPTIIGGDFNLEPDTKSIKMFEEAGFINLIKNFDIKKTRSKNAWKKSMKNQKTKGVPYFGRQNYADYVFVSEYVKINNFKVPDVEISDHLPLILEFEF